MFFRKDKYVAIIVKKVNGKYTEIKRKKVDPVKGVINFDNHTIPINFDNILYRKGLKNFILVDIDNYQQIKDSDKLINQFPSELLDIMLNKSVVKQLSLRLHPSNVNSGFIIFGILFLAVGILAGYFVGNMYPLESIKQAVNQTGVLP